MSLTKTLGQFVADLSPNRLPEGAERIARLGFIDCIGTMIAGRREDCVRRGKEHRAGSRLDQRHRRARPRLRRCRIARPPQYRAGAGNSR